MVHILRLNVQLVVETHPEHQIDLRLHCPWPALKQHAISRLSQWADLDGVERAHTPFIILLLGFQHQWEQVSCKYLSND